MVAKIEMGTVTSNPTRQHNVPKKFKIDITTNRARHDHQCRLTCRQLRFMAVQKSKR
jgi:hypothetical protein